MRVAMIEWIATDENWLIKEGSFTRKVVEDFLVLQRGVGLNLGHVQGHTFPQRNLCLFVCCVGIQHHSKSSNVLLAAHPPDWAFFQRLLRTSTSRRHDRRWSDTQIDIQPQDFNYRFVELLWDFLQLLSWVIIGESSALSKNWADLQTMT